jgi:hypothetical protein
MLHYNPDKGDRVVCDVLGEPSICTVLAVHEDGSLRLLDEASSRRFTLPADQLLEQLDTKRCVSAVNGSDAAKSRGVRVLWEHPAVKRAREERDAAKAAEAELRRSARARAQLEQFIEIYGEEALRQLIEDASDTEEETE